MHPHLNFQGISIPALGLGTWQARGESCTEAVTYALECGYRHIDTAQIYENEAEVGQALAQSSVPRSDIFLTTKIWMDQVADGALQDSVDISLQKLGTDYVDLLLIHWPVEQIPLAQQLGALQAVKDSGKTRLIGVSNFTIEWLEEAKKLAADIVCNQVEYHPFLSQKPVLDWLRDHDMFLTAYSPLARGSISHNEQLADIAQRHKKTPAQVTLRWLIQQPGVVAIPKAVTPQHILANSEVFDFTLSTKEMQQIDELTRQARRLINPGWSPKWDSAYAA